MTNRAVVIQVASVSVGECHSIKRQKIAARWGVAS
jgi:hypothetical protein